MVANTTPPAGFTITPGTGTLTCLTNSTQISVNSTGGVTYTWSAPSTGTLLATGSNTADITGPGIYTVIATGANGCTSSAAAGTVNIAQNITAPSSPTAAANGTLTCSSPQVTLTAAVSPTNATVTWLGGVCGPTTALTTTACAAGIYTAVATDPSNGCTSAATSGGTVNVVNMGIPAITSIASSGTITCTNTMVTVSATATPGSSLSYSWTGSGISGAATNSVISVTSGGTYTLTVMDAANCPATQTYSVPSDNAPITATATSASTITCNSTTSNLNVVVGGSGTFSYNWNGPGVVGTNTMSTATASLGGTYSVTVLNTGNGCSSVETVTVVADTVMPSGIVVSPTTLTLSCTTPTAQLSITATGASSYTWSAPSTGTITAGANTFTADITGPGIYSVVATATNGCSAPQATVDVVADANQPVLALSASNLSITCSNITPTVSATSTISTTQYTWTGSGISSGANSSIATFTNAGTFTVVATNTANGCSTSSVVSIGQNTISPTASVSDVTITCAVPLVTITPNYTPSSGLTYTWSGTAGMSGAIGNSSVMALNAGTLTVNFTDASNGCSGTTTLNVLGSTQVPTVTIASSSSVGVGCSPSNSTVTLTSNTSPTTGLNYSWSTGDLTSAITVTTGGVYTLTVTDPSNSCSSTETISITDNTAVPSASAGANSFIPCGTSSFTLNGSSSNAAATYSWTGAGVVSGANTAGAVINMAGTYTLTVTDSITGCVSQSTVDIQNTVVTASFTPDQTSGISPLTVNFANSSIGAVNYNWSFGNGSVSTQTNTANTYNNSGTFVVTLIASSGPCSDTATVTIVVTDGLSLQIPNVFTPNNDGTNDVFTITSTGVKEMTLEIFNRWGQLMYESKSGAKASWDGMTNNGTTAAAGTYFYFVKAIGFDGNEISKNGPLNLFR
jgi:gliding motility-associated-like protein